MNSIVLMSILMSTPVLSLLSIGLVVLIGFLINKKYVSKKNVDIIMKIFENIENNYKSWGIEGNEKMDVFIKEFIDRYKADNGTVPTDDIIKNAVKIVEKLVNAQK